MEVASTTLIIAGIEEAIDKAMLAVSTGAQMLRNSMRSMPPRLQCERKWRCKRIMGS